MGQGCALQLVTHFDDALTVASSAVIHTLAWKEGFLIQSIKTVGIISNMTQIGRGKARRNPKHSIDATPGDYGEKLESSGEALVENKKVSGNPRNSDTTTATLSTKQHKGNGC